MTLANVGSKSYKVLHKNPVIIRVKRYIHPPSDICLLGRIYKEDEVDRNTNEPSVSCKQALQFERTYWLFALATPLPRSLAFAKAVIAVVLLVLAFAIVFILVLARIPVTLHLWCLWCSLLATQSGQDRLQVRYWGCLRCTILIGLAHIGQSSL